MEIRKFPNISFEHPMGSTFKKYRSQDLAPVRLTDPNFNRRVIPTSRMNVTPVESLMKSEDFLNNSQLFNDSYFSICFDVDPKALSNYEPRLYVIRNAYFAKVG